MKLFDRLRTSDKYPLASAIPAILANQKTGKYVVATAIPAIRAIPREKTGEIHFQNSPIAKIALAKATNQNPEAVSALLAKFCFCDTANEPEPELLTRINNMAWEFMQVDGMAFDDAITLAAEIVVHGKVAACEAAYADVRALWQRISGRQP